MKSPRVFSSIGKVVPSNSGSDRAQGDGLPPLRLDEDDEDDMIGHDIYDEDDPEEYSLPHRMLRKCCRQIAPYCTFDLLLYNLDFITNVAVIDLQISFDDVLSLMAIFVLFANYIKLLANGSKNLDAGFDFFLIICLSFFIFEFISNTIVKTRSISIWPKLKIKGYLFSFFWLMDIIFIIATYADIGSIGQVLNEKGTIYDLTIFGGGGLAGRGARLVRLIKVMQQYKISSDLRKRKNQEQEWMALMEYGDYDDNQLMSYIQAQALHSSRDSKLGTQLKESTIRRIIVIVYSLFFFLPPLVYQPVDMSFILGMQLLHAANKNNGLSNGAKRAIMVDFITRIEETHNRDSIVSLTVTPLSSTPIINREDLVSSIRAEEFFFINYSDTIGGIEYITSATFSNHETFVRQAGLAISMYVFVAIMLSLGYGIITADVQRLVLAPIERMMNMVDEVSRNPLHKLQFDHENNSGGEYEMMLLESTLEKITSLLRVGFGEAGAGIIRANLNMQDGTCTINPLLPGIRIYAIFGFCDIHDFEFVTQQLSNEVLSFVNTIAEIVHSKVHSWRGQCNKNLGNAFVLVWRLGDEEALLANQGGRPVPIRKISAFETGASRNNSYHQEVKKKKEVDLKRVPDIERWADHSLISCLKIVAEINRSREILKYRHESKLTLNGKQDFKVRMGFGLHAGWAIEGAVGSLQKVDATYLSPHVNMAARLETASKQYGVPILMSQNIYELMSDEGKEHCRRIDKVTVKGSEVPIDIYTYDCLQDQVFKEDAKKTKLPEFKPAIALLNGMTPRRRSHSSSRRSFIDQSGDIDVSVNGRTRPNQAEITFALSSMGGMSGSFHGLRTDPPRINAGKDGGSDSSITTIDTKLNRRESHMNVKRRNSTAPNVLFNFTSDSETSLVFERDPDVRMLRSHMSKECREQFDSGLIQYLTGDWQLAREELEQANDIMLEKCPITGGDGPSIALLNYMEEFDFEAPPTWENYRPLTSK